MENTFIELVAITSMIIAFIFEGLSHGWRWKQTRKKMSIAEHKKLGTYWHGANVVFQVFLLTGIYFYNLGSDYSWSGLNGYFFYDFFWVLLRVFLFRYILFSVFNNLASGHSIIFVGTTSKMDIFYRKYIIKWFPPTFSLIVKFFMLLILVLSAF